MPPEEGAGSGRLQFFSLYWYKTNLDPLVHCFCDALQHSERVAFNRRPPTGR